MSGERAVRHLEAAWGTVASSEDRGWIMLAAGEPESLILDEWGDYWWARIEGRIACLIRRCAREEAKRVRESIPAPTRRVLHLD